MKRTIIAASVLALGIVGSGAALADPPGPGFNGNNDYGLCKAYTNHNDEKGKDDPKPFDEETFTLPEGEPYDQYETVAEYCADLLGQPEPGNSDGKGNKGEEETG